MALQSAMIPLIILKEIVRLTFINFLSVTSLRVVEKVGLKNKLMGLRFPGGCARDVLNHISIGGVGGTVGVGGAFP